MRKLCKNIMTKENNRIDEDQKNVFKPESLLFKFLLRFFPRFLYNLHKAIHSKAKE